MLKFLVRHAPRSGAPNSLRRRLLGRPLSAFAKSFGGPRLNPSKPWRRRVAGDDDDKLRQPSLAALVMLHVAERLALAFGDAEIEFLHVLVLAQRLRLAVHHDAAALEDVTVSGVFQRHVGILLGEQERNAF